MSKEGTIFHQDGGGGGVRGLVLALYIHIHVTASLVSLGRGTWQVLRKFRNEFAKSPCLSEAFVSYAALSTAFPLHAFNTLLMGHR